MLPPNARVLRIAAALAVWLAAAPVALADDAAADAGAADGRTGREIYEAVVRNRFRTFRQTARLVSADRAGRSQESRFQMVWKDFRDERGEGRRGVLSKTLVKYTHPFDLRHSGYLIQANDERVNDQFVYYPSRRRIVRVSLRSEAVYGTDFSFEDVIPREAQDFEYERLPDGEVGGVAVHVLELRPREFADSEYSRIRVAIDRERAVVLHARYWDRAGVEVKRFRANPASVREFEGVYVPMQTRMRHLLNESHTRLEVLELVPNPDLEAGTFDLSRLEAH